MNLDILLFCPSRVKIQTKYSKFQFLVEIRYFLDTRKCLTKIESYNPLLLENVVIFLKKKWNIVFAKTMKLRSKIDEI